MSTREMFIVFGETMNGEMIGSVTVNLDIMVLLSEAAGIEREQRALDAYLGIGPAESQSIPQAIMADTTLGGLVEWCMPIGVSSYGRIAASGIEYFGGRLATEVGTSG
jgi:hypothetical protein